MNSYKVTNGAFSHTFNGTAAGCIHDCGGYLDISTLNINDLIKELETNNSVTIVKGIIVITIEKLTEFYG